MKNYFKIGILVAVCALCLNSNNAFAATTTTTQTSIPATYKLAVVDVPVVVAKSSQVQALKKEQQAKKEELVKWLETVRADVQKQQTKEGKEKLLKKYESDFAKKQEELQKEYAKKLKEIDTTITNVIAQYAKAQKYDMVFAKGTVLYGGDDITDAVAKQVK